MEKYKPLDALEEKIQRMQDAYIAKLESRGMGHEETVMASISYVNGIKDAINTLEVKEANNVWHEVDNVNLPQPDKNKIYCVLSKNKYLLARVIINPQDEDLLQWKCTEFPHYRYDMCEGDKYMQIV